MSSSLLLQQYPACLVRLHAANEGRAAINWLSIIWKSDLTDKMKRSFFQVAVVSILLYGSTTWTLTKRLKKKLHGNYTRMQRAILNKSWRQHPTRHQLYGHLSPITKTIQVRIYIYISSSSSCRAASTDIPDPVSPLLPIIHRLRQVFRVTSCVLTSLLYVSSSWSSCFCTTICGGP